MEYYAPAQGAPSTFQGREASDPSSGLPRHEDWHMQHAGPTAPSAPGQAGMEEAMWRMTLHPREGMESPYPERPGELDCAYYMRTGLCGFGMNCRFNHPPNRRLASAVARSRGEYPERMGQPECQYYLKTGTCKFGATCKYHHPREKAGMAGRAQLNVLNLPLRPGEKDCAYYMRTGTCKYGVTCKFNHPQPAAAAIGTLVSMPPGGSPLFPGSGPGSAPAPQPYPAGLPTWPIARAPPYLAGPRLPPGPSNFAPVLLPSPQGVVSVPGWNPYQGHVGPLASPDGQQQQLQTSYAYGAAPPQDPVAMGFHAAFPHYLPGSASMRLPTPPSPSTSGPREPFYPERPGQPECQYYMKTGECKFGSICRFHHPRDRNAPSPTSLLSPMGLPLRPGTAPCTFYSRYGICKFGPTCKFDHPFVGLPYNTSRSSLADMRVPPYALGSASTTFVPSSSETPLELIRQQPFTAGSTSDLAAPTSGAQASHRQSSSRESLEEADIAGQGSGPATSSSQQEIHGSP